KVRPGTHKFRVRAIDAAGNVDPTPAVWKWRVKRRSGASTKVTGEPVAPSRKIWRVLSLEG
ncbi:MAG: hypothetical protein Q7J48_15875, partial [Nocardioides sp.]|nr:hypothetical protein [Nocardioides sp.]